METVTLVQPVLLVLVLLVVMPVALHQHHGLAKMEPTVMLEVLDQQETLVHLELEQLAEVLAVQVLLEQVELRVMLD